MSKMRPSLKGFLFFIISVFLSVLLLMAGAVYLAIDDHATLNRISEITPENIAHAQRILKQNDPRTMKSGKQRTILISQNDLDNVGNYLANRFAQGSARIVLEDDRALITASVPLPKPLDGRFINVNVSMTDIDSVPRFTRFRIGRLPVPALFVNGMASLVFAKLQSNEDYSFMTHVIKKMSVVDGHVAVVYEWQSGLLDKVRSVLLPRGDQERLRLYYEGLADLTRSLAGKNVSLTLLLPPIFQLAQERSRAGDPIEENRAALFVLALYVNDVDPVRLIPAAKDWVHPSAHVVTLNRRDDFSKHFIISAALAAGAGGPLSDAVGLNKEIQDSRGGSGFSFNDIAADRAGTIFGEQASVSPVLAMKLQEKLIAGVQEKDLMPKTSDLPEFMPEREFKRRFGGIGAPRYDKMMDEIERRVASLPLYR